MATFTISVSDPSEYLKSGMELASIMDVIIHAACFPAESLSGSKVYSHVDLRDDTFPSSGHRGIVRDVYGNVTCYEITTSASAVNPSHIKKLYIRIPNAGYSIDEKFSMLYTRYDGSTSSIPTIEEIDEVITRITGVVTSRLIHNFGEKADGSMSQLRSFAKALAPK